LDASKLKFPLKLRKWKQGDWFIPFGMRGKMKLSDYFINQKFSLLEKENVWILASGNDIVWIVGYRVDQRYAIGEKTKKVYLAQVK
jgi:tRNA(Ile)-lysidine synthase